MRMGTTKRAKTRKFPKMKIDVTKIATLFTNLSPIVTSRVVSGVNPPFSRCFFFYLA